MPKNLPNHCSGPLLMFHRLQMEITEDCDKVSDLQFNSKIDLGFDIKTVLLRMSSLECLPSWITLNLCFPAECSAVRYVFWNNHMFLTTHVKTLHSILNKQLQRNLKKLLHGLHYFVATVTIHFTLLAVYCHLQYLCKGIINLSNPETRLGRELNQTLDFTLLHLGWGCTTLWLVKLPCEFFLTYWNWSSIVLCI